MNTSTNTPGVDDDLSDAARVTRATASPSAAALLFTPVMLVLDFCRLALLQSFVEALGFAVFFCRYIGCIVWECTARASFTASSSPAALLFAYMVLRSVTICYGLALLQSVVDALGFAMFVSRYIGCVVQVRTSFALFLALCSSRLCSFVVRSFRASCLNCLFFCLCSIVALLHRLEWMRRGTTGTRA